MRNEKPVEEGQIIETLPNTTFRVRLQADEEIIAHLSGKMRLHYIRVLLGDKVLVEVAADRKRGRITRRL